MAKPNTLSELPDLEARYDGPIPASELSALRHGSYLARDISQTRQEIAFYRSMFRRAMAAARAWRRTNRPDRNVRIQDSRENAASYLISYRNRKDRLALLLVEDAKSRRAA